MSLGYVCRVLGGQNLSKFSSRVDMLGCISLPKINPYSLLCRMMKTK
jgi:hypothetical protein